MKSFSEYLSERKSSVMNAFERKFGRRVYSKDLSVEPTATVVEAIYEVLNGLLFSSRLSVPEIVCGPPEQMSEKLMSSGIGWRKPAYDMRSFYAAYVPVAKIVGMPFEARFKFEREWLFVNADNGKMTFAFLASSICHEMIHQYDAHFGDVAKIYKSQEMTGQVIDIHTTKVFMEKSELANKNMLTVIPNGAGMTFAELNEYMAKRANGVTEADKPSEEEISAALAVNGAFRLPDGRYVIVFGN